MIQTKKIIKTKPIVKSYEKEFEKTINAMLDLISSIYKNQVLLELNKNTINKFTDSQVGNYAKVFVALANRVKRKLVARFNNIRIERIVKSLLLKVNNSNKDDLYNKLEKAIGINAKEVATTEGLKSTTNALIIETAKWVEKLRDDTITQYTNNSLRLMTLGNSLPYIVKEFNTQVDKRKDEAKFIARNQVSNFNSILTKIRLQNLGINKVRWLTSEDDRVRISHKDRDGKEFDLSKGLYSSYDKKFLLPGVDFNCRCTYEIIIED